MRTNAVEKAIQSLEAERAILDLAIAKLKANVTERKTKPATKRKQQPTLVATE